MPAKTWRNWLRRPRNTVARAARRPRRRFLQLEELESRLTPSVTFTTLPSSGVAGQTLSPAVQITVTGQEGTFTFPLSADAVTLAVASGPGAFTPSSSSTAITDKNGVATFSGLTLDAAGNYTFVASESDMGETSAPSGGVVINPGPASQIAVALSSSDVPEGSPVSFAVVAVDSFGNPATGSTIHFSSSTTQASLPADYTFQAGDDGVQVFEAAFTVPGTQTITAAVLNSTVSAAASVEVEAVAPSDIQLNPSASDVPINQPITFSGGFTDPGTLDANTVVIDWNDGSADTSLVLPAQVRSFSADHTYTAEGDYFPTVFISNADGGTGEGSTEVQALPGPIDGAADAEAQPGQTATVSASDAQGNSINAALFLSSLDVDRGGILVAKLGDATLPSSTNRDGLLGIYDIRSTRPEAGDSALVTFRFLATSHLSETPVLQFLNPATGRLETFVPSKHGAFRLTREGKFIVGTLFLDNTSTPSLVQLSHTVFTISVNVTSPAATATVSAAVASTDPNVTAPTSTATFTSTSQLTLTLEPTQAGQVSSGLSSFNSAASGAGGEGTPDDAAAALYSFLAGEVSDGVQAILPFAREVLLPPKPAPAAPAPAAPGTPTAQRLDESLRDASDFLFRELASTESRLSGDTPAFVAPQRNLWVAARPWAPEGTGLKIGRAALLAGLAVAMPERRKKDKRTKTDE
jgi:hypothetical protein